MNSTKAEHAPMIIMGQPGVRCLAQNHVEGLEMESGHSTGGHLAISLCTSQSENKEDSILSRGAGKDLEEENLTAPP